MFIKAKKQMKTFRLYIAIIFPLLTCWMLPAQETTLRGRWNANTAYIIPEGKWESGIVQSFRYGLNKRMELKSNAIIFPIFPNAGLKIRLETRKGFLFASEHSVSYPTLFLNTVSFKGTGGLISPQFHFPFILSISNSLIVTKPIGCASLLSADAGISFSIRNSKPDYQSTIDLPLFYPRMAHYYEGASVRAGLSFKGLISQKLFYEENMRMFCITRNRDNRFAENSGSIMWVASRSIRLKGGYTLSWGKYPFGNHIQMWPTLDIVFGSKIKREHTY